jgi:hypothetical protein
MTVVGYAGEQRAPTYAVVLMLMSIMPGELKFVKRCEDEHLPE